MDSPVLTAFLLSFLAGISTTIGSAVAFLVKKPTYRFLGLALGFSAGVMISVSFIELLGNAIKEIGLPRASLAFFAGFGVIFLIDILIPHEYEAERKDVKDAKLMKAGVLTALGIAIHNFPEGFAVFAGSLQSLRAGLLLAIAIAVHNIPEGISVAVPIFYATGSRRKAFLYSSLSGICEPVGALVGGLILLQFLNDFVISCTLSFVAGIMVYISLDELLPAANRYGEEHVTTLGVGCGMLVMVATLVLLS